MKNYIIFAMRKLRNYIANFRHNLHLPYNKGIVPYSYLSNVLSGFRESKGTIPLFLIFNYFLMRKPENKVISIAYILLLTSSVYNFFYFLSGISKTFLICQS